MGDGPSRARSAGFTLLEILAALAITVIGVAAVVKVTGSAITVMQSAEDRVVASWVASNRLAELRLGRSWPAAATRDHTEKLGGRVWFYREEVSTTEDPDLLRVDIAVYSDKDHADLSAEMFGYLARYSPPSDTPLPWAAELLGGSTASGTEGASAPQTGGQTTGDGTSISTPGNEANSPSRGGTANSPGASGSEGAVIGATPQSAQ